MRTLICGTAIVLAACSNNHNTDLTAAAAAAAAGTITGTVTSNTGSLGSVSVTANPQLGSPQTAATNANGQYSISNVPFGPGSVSVGGVPSGCELVKDLEGDVAV